MCYQKKLINFEIKFFLSVTGCRDDHVDSSLQFVDLRVSADAAEEADRPDVGRPAERVHDLLGLLGELAGRSYDLEFKNILFRME
jgi:hypothetical protein